MGGGKGKGKKHLSFGAQSNTDICTDLLIETVYPVQSYKHLFQNATSSSFDDSPQLLDQEICTFVCISLCAPKERCLFLLTSPLFTPRYHPPLTKLITDPLCFLTAYKSCEVLPVFAGTSDSKNPDPFYSVVGPSLTLPNACVSSYLPTTKQIQWTQLFG